MTLIPRINKLHSLRSSNLAKAWLATSVRQATPANLHQRPEHHQANDGGSSSPPLQPSSRPIKAKQEGSVASVFATLNGESLQDALPPRFADLKQSLIKDDAHKQALQQAWRDVLQEVKVQVEQTIRLGGETIPEINYPGDQQANQPIEQWMDKATLQQIKERGVAVIRGVIPKQQVLDWKSQIQEYAALNSAKGYPSENPQVYELYWTKPQLEARSHPALLRTSQAFLSLFHSPMQDGASQNASNPETAVSLQNPLTYADRLRIRQPGDAQFALGPHIDGGGVERWECQTFRGVWDSILAGGTEWRNHDGWSLGKNGERLGAQTDMYGGPGQCGIFRPLQGWLSMSCTKANQGTLRVLSFLKQSTAYVILRPFFQPKKTLDPTISTGNYSQLADYLSVDNWEFDANSSNFPGCLLGYNIELFTQTHPHLALDQTMTSIPKVEEGDMVFWHCDLIHSVEAQHRGQTDSSVMYIPAIPTTKVNWEYILRQREAFLQGIPPQDFPGGAGESEFVGRGQPKHIQGEMARVAMGLAPLPLNPGMSEAERNLIEACNRPFGSG